MSKKVCNHPYPPFVHLLCEPNMIHHAPTLEKSRMCLSSFAKILLICAIFVPFTEFK